MYIGRVAAFLSPSGREFRQREILSPVGRELGKSVNPHPRGGELTPEQHPTDKLKRLIGPDLMPMSERFEFRWFGKADPKRNPFTENAVFRAGDSRKEATVCLKQALNMTKKCNLRTGFGERLVAF